MGEDFATTIDQNQDLNAKKKKRFQTTARIEYLSFPTNSAF